MNFKEMVKSKTFFLGVATVIFGAIQIVQGNENGAQQIQLGLGMIFLRDGISKINQY